MGAPSRQIRDVPLVLDLDGTVTPHDTLHQNLIILGRDRPLQLIAIAAWLRHGKARFKAELAARMAIDPNALRYNQELVEWARSERQNRLLVLCTAAPERTAQIVAAHLGLFDEVMASNEHTNLRGESKARALVARFGREQFDYAGNDHTDLHVFAVSRNAIVVNPSRTLRRQLGQIPNLSSRTFA